MFQKTSTHILIDVLVDIQKNNDKNSYMASKCVDVVSHIIENATSTFFSKVCYVIALPLLFLTFG